MRMTRTTLNALVGLVGLGEDETARVNITSLGGPDTLPGRVLVTVLDAVGRSIKRSQMEIAPGQSASMDVGFQEVENTPRDGGVARKQLRFELVGFNPQPDPPGLVANVEVFGTKVGDTRFIGDPHVIPIPRGDQHRY